MNARSEKINPINLHVKNKNKYIRHDSMATIINNMFVNVTNHDKYTLILSKNFMDWYVLTFHTLFS